MTSTTTTRPKARKRGAREAARPVEQATNSPDATKVAPGDDPCPLSIAADGVSIVDLHVPTDRELAEANMIAGLEYEAEQNRREAREAADANNWALYRDHMETCEAQGREPAPEQQGGGEGEEAP